MAREGATLDAITLTASAVQLFARRLRGRGLPFPLLLAASRGPGHLAAGNGFASSHPPPSRPGALAASWSFAIDRGLPLLPLALAYAILLAEAGHSELSLGPYWARPITMEQRDPLSGLGLY